MSKKNMSVPGIDAIPEYFFIDFQNDRYEMLDTPLLKRFCMLPEGRISDLEASGSIQPESLHDFRLAKDNLFDLYDKGIEGNSELHLLMYILSADMVRYIPVSVAFVFEWDEESHAVEGVTGRMMIVDKISATSIILQEKQIA